MSIFKKIFKDADKDTEDEKSGTVLKPKNSGSTRPSGAWRFAPAVKPENGEDPVDEIRGNSAKKYKDAYAERLASRELHKSTRTLSLAKIRLKDLLDKDSKFSAFRDEVKNELIDLFVDLIAAAEKGLPDVFYQRIDKKKSKLAVDEHLRHFFWTNFSTWLMGEQFQRGKDSPIWTVLSSTHEELSGKARPMLLASQGEQGKNEHVALMEFVQGSVKLNAKGRL